MVEINPQQPPDQFTNAPPAPDPKTLGELLSQGAKDSGLLGRLWNLFWHGVNDGVVLVVTGVARTIDQLMIWVGDFFRVAQGEKNPEFWVLVATITEDLTGVPVDAEELKKAYFGSGRLAAMGVTGGSLLDLLGMEFIAKSGAGSKGDVKRGTGIGGLQTGTITPEQGVEAARRFLGFGMSFAIRQGNLAAITSMIPEEYRIADGFREYGELMAKNLGLGRLTRLVLRPYLQEMVVTPLEWAVRKQYRPTLLSESQSVKAYLRGYITNDVFVEEMQRRGYSDERITHLVEVERQRLPVSGLERLVRYGVMQQPDAIKALQIQGWTADDAALALANVDLERLDALWDAQATEWRTQFTNGVIDHDQFNALISTLPITEREKKAHLVLAATKVELPRKFLTLAQMQHAYEQGIVDLNELQDYFRQEGYSSDDSFILLQLTLLATNKLAEAAAAKAARASAKTPKTTPPTP